VQLVLAACGWIVIVALEELEALSLSRHPSNDYSRDHGKITTPALYILALAYVVFAGLNIVWVITYFFVDDDDKNQPLANQFLVILCTSLACVAGILFLIEICLGFIVSTCSVRTSRRSGHDSYQILPSGENPLTQDA